MEKIPENNLDFMRDLLTVSAKKLGYTTPEQIEEHYEEVVQEANNYVQTARNRMLTLSTEKGFTDLFAAKYLLKTKHNNGN